MADAAVLLHRLRFEEIEHNQYRRTLVLASRRLLAGDHIGVRCAAELTACAGSIPGGKLCG
jgi:hypothetical protein